MCIVHQLLVERQSWEGMINSPAFPRGCLWPEKVIHNKLQVLGLQSDMICMLYWDTVAYSIPF